MDMKSKIFGALIAGVLSLDNTSFAVCKKNWVFFDLGNTIVDTKTFDERVKPPKKKINKFNPMFYLVDADKSEYGSQYQHAKEYVDALVQAGHKLGTIIDVPEEWGPTPAQKIAKTKKFLSGDPTEQTSWGDKFNSKLDWLPFDGRILLPQTKAERKDQGSLVLFERARDAAAKEGCVAVYQGENDDQMDMAERGGVIPFRVGLTFKKRFYLPVTDVDTYVSKYKKNMKYWSIPQ